MTNTASNEQVTSEILHRLRRLENHQNIQAVNNGLLNRSGRPKRR